MLIDTPRRATVNNKRLISKRKKSEKKYAYIKAMTFFYKELQREITLIALAPSSYVFIISICLEDRNVFARFDEIPSMTLRYLGNCPYKSH